MFKGPKKAERLSYFVAGINGAGKTTVLERLTARHPEIFHVRASQKLMLYMGFGQDYERLRAHPHLDTLQKFDQLVRGLVVTYGHDPMMFDAHVLNIVRGEMKDVTGDWLELFDAMVLIEARPEIVMDRLERSSRDQALFPPGLGPEEKLESISHYQVIYRRRFMELAEQYGKYVIRVTNNIPLPETARKLKRRMDKYAAGVLD